MGSTESYLVQVRGLAPLDYFFSSNLPFLLNNFITIKFFHYTRYHAGAGKLSTGLFSYPRVQAPHANFVRFCFLQNTCIKKTNLDYSRFVFFLFGASGGT